MKKQFLVIPKDDSLIDVDYIIDVHENMYTIKYSHSMQWSSDVRGKSIGSIVDTGDGVILSDCFAKRDLNYSLLSELTILLSFINGTDELSYKFRIAEIKRGEDE